MITTKIHRPLSFVKDFVECIYINKGDNYEEEVFNAPSLNQELFFYLGDSFTLTSFDKNSVSVNQRSWINGINTKASVVRTKGKHFSAGILFKPWGLYQGFGIHGKAVSNSFLNPAALLGHAIVNSVYQNRECPESELFYFIEQALINNCKPRKIPKAILLLTNDDNFCGFEKGILNKVSGHINITPKSFIQAFNTALGISPVKYLHLKAINKAIKLMQENNDKNLTEIGYASGFFDQSHFIRVFKSYIGHSPGTWRALSNQ